MRITDEDDDIEDTKSSSINKSKRDMIFTDTTIATYAARYIGKDPENIPKTPNLKMLSIDHGIKPGYSQIYSEMTPADIFKSVEHCRKAAILFTDHVTEVWEGWKKLLIKHNLFLGFRARINYMCVIGQGIDIGSLSNNKRKMLGLPTRRK